MGRFNFVKSVLINLGLAIHLSAIPGMKPLSTAYKKFEVYFVPGNKLG